MKFEDLTTLQLAVLWSALTGEPLNAKRFNTKGKAQERVSAKADELGLSEDDVMGAIEALSGEITAGSIAGLIEKFGAAMMAKDAAAPEPVAEAPAAVAETAAPVAKILARNGASMPAPGTKNWRLLALVCRPEGGTTLGLCKALGWSKVRGTLSTFDKKLGLQLTREKAADEGILYRGTWPCDTHGVDGQPVGGA